MAFKGHRRPLLWLRSLFCGDRYDFHGNEIHLPGHLQSAMQWMVLNGQYEEAERRLVERFLSPDVPVVELGGSLEVLSSYIGGRINPTTPFVVLEANPEIVELCRRNATADGTRSNVHVINAALAYDSDTVSFHASRKVHVSRLASPESPGNVTVPATNLAQLLHEQRIENEFALICDIEGAEWDLHLRDGDALGRCALAIIELHPTLLERHGRTVQSFLDRMATYGLNLVAREADVYAFRRA